jgi:uncharacterized protein
MNQDSSLSMSSSQIPSKDECLQLIAETKMMDHIIQHSKQVSRVALFLADRLIAADFTLNRELIFAAALLHDITKTRSFATGENHAKTGSKMLQALGYPEVGKIIGQHVHLDRFHRHEPPNEAEVVNYADKRVLHANVVSLTKRMTYIVEQYGSSDAHKERIKYLWQETEQLEQKLFSSLKLDADDLTSYLDQTPPNEPK